MRPGLLKYSFASRLLIWKKSDGAQRGLCLVNMTHWTLFLWRLDASWVVWFNTTTCVTFKFLVVCQQFFQSLITAHAWSKLSPHFDQTRLKNKTKQNILIMFSTSSSSCRFEITYMKEIEKLKVLRTHCNVAFFRFLFSL